jgi:hypothetical protein
MAPHTLFATTGERGGAADLARLGRQKQALFWRLPGGPGTWHDVTLDLAGAYDRALGEPGAYAKLGVTQVQVALGVWCDSPAGSRSEAWFDGIRVEPRGAKQQLAITVDGTALPVGPDVFKTEFGARDAGGEANEPGTPPTRRAKKKRKASETTP